MIRRSSRVPEHFRGPVELRGIFTTVAALTRVVTLKVELLSKTLKRKSTKSTKIAKRCDALSIYGNLGACSVRSLGLNGRQALTRGIYGRGQSGYEAAKRDS